MWGLARELLSSRFFPYFNSSFFWLPARPDQPPKQKVAYLENSQDSRVKKLFYRWLAAAQKTFLTLDKSILQIFIFSVFVSTSSRTKQKRFKLVGFDYNILTEKSDRSAPVFKKEQNFL